LSRVFRLDLAVFTSKSPVKLLRSSLKIALECLIIDMYYEGKSSVLEKG